jgi:hypothetical protein
VIVKNTIALAGKNYEGVNPYFQPNPSQKILKILKEYDSDFS